MSMYAHYIGKMRREAPIYKLLFITGIVLSAFVISGAARAQQSIFEQGASYISGTTSITTPFPVEVPGQHQAKLTNFEFPVALQEIGSADTRGDILLGSIKEQGSFFFHTQDSENFLARVYGAAEQSASELGLYHVQAALMPRSKSGA